MAKSKAEITCRFLGCSEARFRVGGFMFPTCHAHSLKLPSEIRRGLLTVDWDDEKAADDIRQELMRWATAEGHACDHFNWMVMPCEYCGRTANVAPRK